MHNALFYFYKIVQKSTLLFSLLLLFVSMVEAQTITTYNTCNLAQAGDIVDLSNGNLTNYDLSILGTAAPNSNSIADPSCVSSSGTTDAWVRFSPIATNAVTFEFTPTTPNRNAALVFYRAPIADGCAGLQLMRCADTQGNNGTESITLNVTLDPNFEYYIRLINLNNVNDLAGKMTIYNGTRVLGDICQDAQEISVGTCNFNFNVDASFFNNEGHTDPSGCTAPVVIDGWVKFYATQGQVIGVDYTSFGAQATTLDAAIAVYTGRCDSLVQMACSNRDTTGMEILEYVVPNDGMQYIRIINVENAETLTGSICIYEVITRNTCAELGTAISNTTITPLNVGACGIKANVFESNSLSVANANACVSVGHRDAWIPFRTDATTEVLLEYSANSTGDVDIAIFDASAIDCSGEPTPVNCISNSLGTITLQFQAQANVLYYIQLVNVVTVTNPSPELLGTICLYNASKKAEDNFFTANNYLLDNSDCGVQFNILADFNNTGGASVASPEVIACSALAPRTDAWASFTTPNPLGTLNEVTIEYDNDNQDASQADDVALLIYRGNTITSTPATATDINNPASGTAINFDTFYEGIAIPASGGQVWARIEITQPGFYTLVGEALQETMIELYEANQSTLLANFLSSAAGGIAQGTYEFTTTGTYFVSIINTSFDPITTARFGVFSPLTEVACINEVIEGVETITIKDTDDLAPNATYFIRVANVGNSIDLNNPASLRTLQGKLCIRDGSIKPDDICSTARQLVVGDCNISFPLVIDSLLVNQSTTIASTCLLGGKTLKKDAWATFNATNTRTTVEYLNLTSGQDAAIVIYRGTCNNLVKLGSTCDTYFADDVVVGLESITFNTLVGSTYYVQILNVSNVLNDMDGKLCIFNTTERDVCDDNDLVTLRADVCNLRMNVPLSFVNAGTNYLGAVPDTSLDPAIWERNTCGPTSIDYTDIAFSGSRDAWVRYQGNGNLVTIQYENLNDAADPSNPMMILYTAVQGPGPVDCSTGINGAGNPLNQFACANDVNAEGQQTESITFQSVAGQMYILRLIDLTAGDMKGTLCIFSGQKAPDAACNAIDIDITSPTGAPVDIGKCNIQFNVTPDNDGCATPAPDVCVGGTCHGVAWAKFTVGVSSPVLPANNITVQYDNSTNAALSSVDVAIEIYRQDTDCSTLTFVGCADDIVEGFEQINIPAIAVGETYYLRVINKSATNTAFGKLCIFYGESIAQPNCAETIDYGQINGVWRDFTVLGTWTDTRPQNTITEPTPCAIPGGSNPVAPNPPVVSNGWTHFTIPIDSDITAVTVQFDNYDFAASTTNSENAALAVYLGRPADQLTLPSQCTIPNNLVLIDCANSVWRGTESVSVQVQAGSTYYVRVMNVKNIGKDMPGRLRIFEFSECTLGPELVIDGTFSDWGEVYFDGDGKPASVLPQDAISWYDMETWRFQNPTIDRYRTNLSNLSNHINSYARFATDYGYVEDKNGGQTGVLAPNSLNRLRVSTGEFNKEGLYAVSQQGFSRKEGGFSGTDFYGYGHGYTGWGGFKYESYCETGDPQRAEACDGYGLPELQMPALIPHTADANFMIVTGLWNKNNGSTDPNKVWCQTIDIDAPVRPVRYYIFSVWIQNMVRIGANLDVPQIRVTACDMENPNTGQIDNAGVVLAGRLPSPAFDASFTSVLPGVTFTPALSNPNELTYHYPQPPNNADMEKTAPLGFSFGAAMPCNIPGTEPDNARLKALGSDLFIPESPDQWLVIRCVYRAPENARHFNLCIENLSLDKNGNDFGIDDISIRQCLDPNIDALENLLRGDACELATNAAALGVPLATRLIDFSGKLLGDKVGLSWMLINEGNLNYFELQRSINGTDFSPIGTIEANGSEQQISSYQFIDENLPFGRKQLYYRLRLVNRDGYAEMSEVITINIEQLDKINLKLYPNPVAASGEVTLEFQAIQGKASILITDLVGTPLKQQIFDTPEGNHQITFNTEGLSSGIYIIKVQNGNRYGSKKLVISQ